MKKLKERSSTIKNAVESLSSQPPVAVENIPDKPPVTQIERPKQKMTHVRLSQALLELFTATAHRHGISMKSFVLLSGLWMRNADDTLVSTACANLFQVEGGISDKRASLTSSARFTDQVIPDISNRFNGNVTLAFKASAAYVASLSQAKASTILREAMEVDMRMNYKLTAAPRK
ncbi:hypothetical protein [Pseudomonas putida]